jgi:glycosyltransferase involved in cell wall biosynthesis
MGGVIVSHPHAAAFAVGVATAFGRAGRLAAFVTGVSGRRESWAGRALGGFAGQRPVLQNRLLSALPPGRLWGLAPVELGARLVGKGLSRFGAVAKPYDVIFVAHDAAVAALPWPRGTTAIYAYEDGALWTFRRAARAGMARIWDLPLPHYQFIEELLRGEARRWDGAQAGPLHREPEWKRRRKDAELALATQVSVASAFTRHSLERLELQVPVAVVPYGFPVAEFQPRARPPEGRFTVLAVGSHDLRKGTPYLLEAWRRAEIPDAELHLVGPMRLAKAWVDRYAGLFRHSPHVPKSELPAHYAAADLLAFPTLGDGFGLVIQEAMCCGTPVVTTPCGGGPECITDGVDGWLIPPRDIDALVERLRAAAADRARTAAIGRAARARAERWTWQQAGDAYVRAFEV